MAAERQSKRRALDAIEEAIRLLNLADRSVNEARSEFEGDVHELATRMSRQLGFLSEVAELLYHEIVRERGGPGAKVIAFPARLLPDHTQTPFKSR